jgi:hypothetical protein
MKMEQTECSETSAHKFQTLANHPKEIIQHSEHEEIFKSRRCTFMCVVTNRRLTSLLW